jgi:hypothetical protein
MIRSLCGSGLTKANPRIAPEVSYCLRKSLCLGSHREKITENSWRVAEKKENKARPENPATTATTTVSLAIDKVNESTECTP